METIERRNILALQGKYCKDCIIYTEDVEDEAVGTVGYLLGNPLFRDTRIRVMPETLDEAPGAYKDTDSILESLGQTCTVQYRMLPKINIKNAE